MHDIHNDDTSGSVEITIKILQELFSLIASSPPEHLHKNLLNKIHELINLQPMMALPVNMLLRTNNYLESHAVSGVTAQEMIQFISSLNEGFVEAQNKLITNGKQYLANFQKFLTFSNSSLVLDLLLAMQEDKSIMAFVTESRPQLEGRILAEKLANRGIPVIYGLDAAWGTLASDCDVILLGADRITDTEVWNKVGSLTLVALARMLQIPIYIVTTTHKYLPESIFPIKHVDYNPDQIWGNPPENIIVWNRYFEAIPLKYITGFITEDGLVPAEHRFTYLK
jgi:translation initiation factor 2B subunit (eIF-2B alpha/beta/delta family)